LCPLSAIGIVGEITEDIGGLVVELALNTSVRRKL